ncbi:MAG: hypothetical protein WAM14_22400 [Candidatus Nitrosopolaris sp.]
MATVAKCAGIEPKIVSKNLFVQMAYNQKHQLAVAKQISEFIESKKQDIKLLVVNNLTKFFKESRQKLCCKHVKGSFSNNMQDLRAK